MLAEQRETRPHAINTSRSKYSESREMFIFTVMSSAYDENNLFLKADG